MSSVLTPSSEVAPDRPSKPAALPAFRTMALAGFAANAPLIALCLLLIRVQMAGSLLGGYILAMLVYGVLFLIVTRGFSPSAVGRRTGTAAKSGRPKMPGGFTLLMIGKFALSGIGVYVLLIVLNLAAVFLLAGFLITQIGVTAAIMKYLNSTKVTD